MKKFLLFLMVLSGGLLFTSCKTSNPEKYFSLAVLNSNMISGFASDGLSRELESSALRMIEGQVQTVATQRAEIINERTKYLEDGFKKLQQLEQTAETKEILKRSLELYEFVLPVYKNEYTELARLYDNGASKADIDSKFAMIHEKYYRRYSELYDQLIDSGKSYAMKYAIKVNWNM